MNLNDELKTVDYTYLKDTLIESVNISEYLTARGELDIGISNKIRCPLPEHDDSTPSFFYNDNKGVFKCFGCGKGGTVVELHSIMAEIPHEKAIEDLCLKYGIALNYTQSRDKKERSKKGLSYFKKIKDSKPKNLLEVRIEKAMKLTEDYAYKLSLEDRQEVYELCDMLFVSVGLSKNEKNEIVKTIEDKFG